MRTQRSERSQEKSRYPAQIGKIVLIKYDLPRRNGRITKITEFMTSFDETESAVFLYCRFLLFLKGPFFKIILMSMFALQRYSDIQTYHQLSS